MNTPILNRDSAGNFQHPADGFYQIEAKGYHPVSGGRKIVQVIDDKAISSIATHFNLAAAGGNLRHGNEMLIDREHFKHDPDKSTEAYGWMARVQGRADGLYAKNRWTDTGKPKVDGGTYRFFSTEYDPADMEEVQSDDVPETIRNQFKGYKFMRPLKLDGLTLTNMNNNRGQRAMTNRENLRDDPANPPAGKQADTIHMKNLIANRLNVSADAPDEAFSRAVGLLADERDALKTENTTLKNRQTELEASQKILLDDQCEALMSAHGLKPDDAARKRLLPVLAGLKNREERIATLVDFGFKAIDPAKVVIQTQLHNRDGRAPVKAKKDGEADATAERREADKITNRASALRKEIPHLSLADAYLMAQRELADA